jgi:hypothetical protein
VKHFKQPNDANLFGSIECFIPLEQDNRELLAELIGASKNKKYHLILEDISYEADVPPLSVAGRFRVRG